MTVKIPDDLLIDLEERAKRLKLSLDEIVRQAIHRYLAIDPELLEEIAAWEAIGLEALARFEESLPE